MIKRPRYPRSRLQNLFIATLALALSACGGGGSEERDPPPTPDNTPEPVTRMETRPNNSTCLAPDRASDTATQLSATGCFSSADTREVVEGVIPYTVNNLLWSDGEKKGRYFAIPDGSYIRLVDDSPSAPLATGVKNGDFIFPTGSVIIKHFFSGSRIVETRLLMNHAIDGWAGYAYEWNDAQTDATLLNAGKQITSPVSHYFPSPAECMECHTGADEDFTGVAAARVALGPDTLQLNYTLRYTDGSSENYLDALSRLGFFDINTPLAATHKQARLYALADTSASVEARARSYLHSNCSSCHRPGGGPAGGLVDLRFNATFTPFELAAGITSYNACNAEQGATDQPTGATKIIAPGDANHSALFLRINSTDATVMMPPVGRATIDTEAVQLIEGWINGLSGC